AAAHRQYAAPPALPKSPTFGGTRHQRSAQALHSAPLPIPFQLPREQRCDVPRGTLLHFANGKGRRQNFEPEFRGQEDRWMRVTRNLGWTWYKGVANPFNPPLPLGLKKSPLCRDPDRLIWNVERGSFHLLSNWVRYSKGSTESPIRRTRAADIGIARGSLQEKCGSSAATTAT